MSHKSSSSSPPSPWELTTRRLHEEFNELREQLIEFLQLLKVQTENQNPPNQEQNHLLNGRPIRPPHLPPPRTTYYEREINVDNDFSGSGVEGRMMMIKGSRLIFWSLNPDEFLDWLNEVEPVFEFKEFFDVKKCKVAVPRSSDYASVWWENVRKQRDRERKDKVRSWEELKLLMKKRFLLKSHRQDLHLKMQKVKHKEKELKNTSVQDGRENSNVIQMMAHGSN